MEKSGIFESNKIETLGAHMLRATYSHLVARLINPEAARIALRHDKIRTKVDNYLKYEDQGYFQNMEKILKLKDKTNITFELLNKKQLRGQVGTGTNKYYLYLNLYRS